jgi:protein TonB
MSTAAPLPLSNIILPRRLISFIALSIVFHTVVIAAGLFFKPRFEQAEDVISISAPTISVLLIEPQRETIVEEPPEPVIEKKIITTEASSAVTLPFQKEEPIKKKPVKPKVVENKAQKKRVAQSPKPKTAAQPVESFAPQPIFRPKPKYPLVARRRGTEGEVTLEISLLDDGRVNRAQVVKSSGSSALDRSALDTIKIWRFPASRFNSLSSFRQRIKFRLNDY